MSRTTSPNRDTGCGFDTITLNELKEYFECPVCYVVPRRPPIYQCDKVCQFLELMNPDLNNSNDQLKYIYKSYQTELNHIMIILLCILYICYVLGTYDLWSL